MTLSDFLAILDIVVTFLIGFVITHIVSVRDSRTRAIKDYYIRELAAIKAEINNFYSQLFKGEYEAKDIISWHSSIRNRINSFDKAVRKTFRLYDAGIKERLFLNYKHITNSEDFNANYATGKIIFGAKSKGDIGYDERKLYLLIDQTLYDINNARAIDYIERKCQEVKSHYYYYRMTERKNKVKSCVLLVRAWFSSHMSSILSIVFVLAIIYIALMNLGRFLKQDSEDKSYRELRQHIDSLNVGINEIRDKRVETPSTIDFPSSYYIRINGLSSSDTLTLRGYIKGTK